MEGHEVKRVSGHCSSPGQCSRSALHCALPPRLRPMAGGQGSSGIPRGSLVGSFLLVRVLLIACGGHHILPAAPVPGSREHPLVLKVSENAPFCPRFPENRAVHSYSREKEIGMTVWCESDGTLLFILRSGVIEWDECRNTCDSFFFDVILDEY